MRFARRSRIIPFHQKYLGYEIEGHRIRLPLLNIRLIGPTGSLKTIALVDSGATQTFVPPELAVAVGMERIGAGEAAVGAGGSFPTDDYRYRIQLLKQDRAILDLEGVCLVPTEPDRIPYPVLGRDSIFQKYDIAFRETRHVVALKPARGAV